ncbi:hypothetical protein Naga_100872g1 [Nannochloropsis gaditana]|uniref:Uncharacterized protein n=1 Tax=Nannochloropsis gaditana TaxID=72520 RepID=W7TLG1_9STRA|nr:hypothetical protein Naga_100872g1 [Nannochloropsis gaditana]
MLDNLQLFEAKVGKLRCLEALGDYPSLLVEATRLKNTLLAAGSKPVTEEGQPREWAGWTFQPGSALPPFAVDRDT